MLRNGFIFDYECENPQTTNYFYFFGTQSFKKRHNINLCFLTYIHSHDCDGNKKGIHKLIYNVSIRNKSYPF
jgi:hypothetical protein